jgi:hypothetical protein
MYMISGKPHFKKRIIVGPFGVFSLSSRTSDITLNTARAPQRSSPPCYFSYPHPRPSRGLLSEDEAGQLALNPLADSPTLRTLSKMVVELRRPSLRLPRMSWLALSSSPSKVVWSPTWQISSRAAGPHESSVNCHSSLGPQYRRWKPL